MVSHNERRSGAASRVVRLVVPHNERRRGAGGSWARAIKGAPAVRDEADEIG